MAPDPESPKVDPGKKLEGYETWIERQPLAPRSRHAYLERVKTFLHWLAGEASEFGDPLADPHARDYAVRDFKQYLKRKRKASPRTVNLTLAALDHFYRFLGLDPPRVRREELPDEAPRALDAFVAAVNATGVTKLSVAQYLH